MSPHGSLRLARAAACALAALLLTACTAGAPTGPTGAPRTVTLGNRLPLRLELPPGYELQVERAATFDIFQIARVPPAPLAKDTTLGIFVGMPYAPYCPPDTGSYRPAAFHAWNARWHLCREPGADARVWEADIVRGTPVPLHVFIIGTDAAEIQRLRAIAETLRPGGG
ncbi:MAG TPA: hypothetical protein VKB51_07605 [bacterium]|nr:hypothetical protein [bacterium]